jgi:thioredoxin 1
MASANVAEFTADNWVREVVSSDQPVLVDFWGPGCAPCTRLAPVIDSIAGQFAGRVKVGKVNIAENYELANEYRISSIPRVLIFRSNKKPLRQFTGLVAERDLVKALTEVLQEAHR